MKKKEEELFIPKTKYKGLKIFIGIVLILGLLIGGYFLYQYKFNNPKTIVNSLLGDAKENIKKSLVSDIGNDKYKVDGYLKVDANLGTESSEITSLLKDLELAFSGEVDPSNSIGNIAINTKYKNDKLIDFKTYYENNIIYLLLDEIYDKYLKIDSTEEQKNSVASTLPNINIKPKDMETLIDALIDSLKEEVNKLDIEKTDATITVDGKDVNVINNYIELQNKEVSNFIKGIINNLKRNNNFTNTLKKLTDKDVEEILDEVSMGMTSDLFQGIYKINFYTDKGLFNKKLISIRQTITQQGITMSVNFDKINDDEIELSLSMMGMSYSLRLKKTNSVINLSLSESMLGMYFKIDLNMNYEKIKEITKPDISNNKNINELTEKEQKKIEENLANNKALEKFYKEIEKSSKGNSEV